MNTFQSVVALTFTSALLAALVACATTTPAGQAGAEPTALDAASADPPADGAVDVDARDDAPTVADATADAHQDPDAAACKPIFAKCDNTLNLSQVIDPAACGVAPFGQPGSPGVPSCVDFCKANPAPGAGGGTCAAAPAGSPMGAFVCTCFQA
jgi:hypothetical protein